MEQLFSLVVIIFVFLAYKIIGGTLFPRQKHIHKQTTAAGHQESDAWKLASSGPLIHHESSHTRRYRSKYEQQRDLALREHIEQQKKMEEAKKQHEAAAKGGDAYRKMIESLTSETSALYSLSRKTPMQSPREQNAHVKENRAGLGEYDPIHRTFMINYRDGDGVMTEREITIKRIYRKNYRDYIEAYCHFRQDRRTFKLENIDGYLIDTDTGEMIDPDALSPLKAQQNQAISGDVLNDALFLQITETADGWVLHHPKEKVTRKEDRKKREITLYQNKIDCYRSAVRLANERETKVLCIFQHGNYRPKPPPKGAEYIKIIYVDLYATEGLAKLKRVKALKL